MTREEQRELKRQRERERRRREREAWEAARGPLDLPFLLLTILLVVSLVGVCVILLRCFIGFSPLYRLRYRLFLHSFYRFNRLFLRCGSVRNHIHCRSR